MKKEFVESILGPDFGVVSEENLTDGKVLKVKSDEWGKFVIVVDAESYVLFEGDVIVDELELAAHIDDVKDMFP